MLKGQKGVTLVALVITIIVLLILAGVSISLVMGENGVLTQAQGAVVAQKIGGAREKLESAVAAMEMTYKTDWAKNTSAKRSDTYKGLASEAAGVKTYYTTLKAFQAELEANGLVYATWSDTDKVATRVNAEGTAVADLTGLPAANVGSAAPTDYLYFMNGTDIFKVKMYVNDSTGALVVSELLAWDGSAFKAE